MKISILTLFPEMFNGPFDYSIIKRAQDKKLLIIEYVNIRDFATDKYKTVDDRPFGGGTGMILRVDVLHRALKSVTKHTAQNLPLATKIVLLTPTGPVFTQAKAREFAKLDHLILICGHYEGTDARIEKYIDEKLSIGNYVLTGGEIPAMVVLDSVARLLPNVLKKEDATQNESFTKINILEHPQYTRPQVYENHSVPRVLLSGNHKEIELWRTKNSPLLNTKQIRSVKRT